MTERIEFFFDPLCPWAYQASLWIRNVRDQIDIEIDWSFFSLEESNRPDGKAHPWEREWAYGWSLMRVGALLRRRSMADLECWYAVIGEALHSRGEKPHRREVAQRLAEDAGFEAGIVDQALADSSTSDEVLNDHERAVNQYGAFGVPTIVFADGQGLFGPKIAIAPTGQPALRLWDITLSWREFPHLYEIKRPQRPEDIIYIAEAFEPYLKARDWQTIEKDAPGI